MHEAYEFNSLDFILNGGVVSIAVAACLVLMSVTSWYLMISKSYALFKQRIQHDAFVAHFWRASSCRELDYAKHSGAAASQLTVNAIAANDSYHKIQTIPLAERCNLDEYLARNMRQNLSAETAHLESGLTVLASVGSVSPFVGLFGTVWGIYHALATISQTGQATLDKVAGPVGEALIMTALGLAVAIPAVLAYNAIVRSNRVFLGELEAYAHDLHVYLTTGIRREQPASIESNQQSAQKWHGVGA